MIGSCFITHNNTWSCSNECSLGIYTEPIMENGKVIATKERKTLTVKGIFNSTEPLKKDDICEFVIKPDDKETKYSLAGKVFSVSQLQIIINILSKTDKVSEILSNITVKN
jgi:hypothetical protein